MNTLIRFLQTCDIAFVYITRMAWPLKTLTIATFLILGVPFAYTLNPDFYTNTRHASSFFSVHLINNLLLILHIIAALPAIIFGPFLLDTNLRKERPHIHRALGKWYMLGCMSSAVLVLPLALANTPGTPASLGFSVMATIWFLTTFFAYNAARNKNFAAHRRWVIRSYAMTFAFVHVNLTFRYLLPYEHLSLDAIKVFQSMISWQANLFITEIYLAATTTGNKPIGWKKFMQNITTISPHDKLYWRKRTG